MKTKREHRIVVALNEREMNFLRVKADQEGLAMPSYVRTLIIKATGANESPMPQPQG